MDNMNLGNDMVELAKVWNNLSEDMQKLLAGAIGGVEYADGVSAVISEIGNFDNNDTFFKSNIANMDKLHNILMNELRQLMIDDN